MRVSARAPLALAAVAVALAAYILLVERHGASTDEVRTTRPRLLGDLRGADVTRIEIDRSATGPVVLARAAPPAPAGGAGDEWRLLPAGAPAAATAVVALMDTLDGLEIDRETDAAPATTGVSAPAARLALTTPARRWELALGHADASGRGVFVRVAGDPRTLVVNRRLLDLLGGGAAAFRERRLFAPGLIESATALAFESRGASRRTLRKRGGLWLGNDGFFAAHAGASQAVGALAALAATDFPMPSVPPPAPAARTLDITTATGPPPRLEIWEAAPGVCGADGAATLARVTADSGGPVGSWICLEVTAVQRLWRALAAADHRETRLLPVEPTSADGVILVDGRRRLHLRRDPATGWRITEPAVGYGTDPRVVDDWLAQLGARQIAAGAPPGAAAGGGRRLTIEGAVGAQIDVAMPTRGAKAQVRVDRAGETGPATSDATLFAALEPEPLRFRSRAVLSLPRFDVTGVSVTSAGGRTSSVRRGPGEAWVSAGPAEADGAALDRMLSVVADLQARRFPTPAPPFEAERTLDFDLREGTTPRRQRLELSHSCLARLIVDGPEMVPNMAPGIIVPRAASVFEVDATTCADLRRSITLGE